MTPPTTDFHRQRNLDIERAHLMIQRGQLDEARRFLEQIRSGGPRDPEVEALLADIAGRQGYGKAVEENRRAWRYWLNLNAAWRRLCLGVGACALLACGLYNGWLAVLLVSRVGVVASVTTQVYVSGGRYRPGHYVDWTRPAYVDVLYSGAILAAGIIMIWVLIRVSKGAAQWEELEDSYGQDW